MHNEYTTLKINYGTLVIAQEFLPNEPHDATNHVVKIDIATSCDDLIDESIEQGSCDAHYMLRKDSSGKMKVMFLGPPNKSRPKKIWVAKSLVEKVKGPQ